MKNSHLKNIDSWDMVGMEIAKLPPHEREQFSESTLVDGGDSCHYTGLFYYLYFSHKAVRRRDAYRGRQVPVNLTQAYYLLESKTFFGGLKRHPDRRYWYSDDNRMSRDQATPMLAALAISGSTTLLWRQFKTHCRRLLLFTTNTRRNGTTAANDGARYGASGNKIRNYSWKLPDVTLFDFLSIYIRGFNWWFLYPLLLLGDLQLLVGALVIIFDKEDMDVANFFVKHSLSRRILPTPISWLTQKLLRHMHLASRALFNYSRPGMPKFLCNILREAMQEQIKAR